VPLVSIVSGRCFAGNAALAGTCDVIIATPEANIGMGGPAMIEGGGLGQYRPEDIGPIDVQRRNGVVGLAAATRRMRCPLAKQYLSYFQGRLADWEAPDPRRARHVVPENRLRAYDVHHAIDSVTDAESVWSCGPTTESAWSPRSSESKVWRSGWSPTAVIISAGAIDAEGRGQDGRLFDALRIGWAADHFAVRYAGLHGRPGCRSRRRRPAVQSAVHRWGTADGAVRGYGHPAQGLRAGRDGDGRRLLSRPGVHCCMADRGRSAGWVSRAPFGWGSARNWPAVADPVERQNLFDKLVEAAYQHGKALTSATTFELDDVIDPARLPRGWIVRLSR